LNGENDDWLEVEIEEVEEEGSDSDNTLTGPQSGDVTDAAMKLAGENRRNSMRLKLQEES